MACFLVPMALAIMFSIVQKVSRSAAEKLKLWVLNALLWGGVMLLALEHIWHGEVVLWPPFITAMSNPADIPIMLYEVATIGTVMAATTIAVWGIILAVSYYMPKIIAARVVENAKKTFSTIKP